MSFIPFIDDQTNDPFEDGDEGSIGNIDSIIFASQHHRPSRSTSLWPMSSNEVQKPLSFVFERPFGDPSLEPRPMAPDLSLEPLPLDTPSARPKNSSSAFQEDSSTMANLVDIALNVARRGTLTSPSPAWVAKGEDIMTIWTPQIQMVITDKEEEQQGFTSTRNRDLHHYGDDDSNGDSLLLLMPKAKRQKCQTAAHDEERVSRFTDHHEGLWQEQFQKLVRFQEESGHCNIQITFAEDQTLARWVKRQRYQYKRYQEGKPSAMSAQRIDSLACIGFVWDAHGAAWQEKYRELCAFKQVIGHCNVATNDLVNVQLSTWVKCQRRQRRLFQAGKKSHMTLGRIEALDSLGFVWNIRKSK